MRIFSDLYSQVKRLSLHEVPHSQAKMAPDNVDALRQAGRVVDYAEATTLPARGTDRPVQLHRER
jgi:hypothetical protein